MHCFVGSLLFVIPHVQLLLFGSVAHPFALFLNLCPPNQENELLRFVFQFTPTKGWFSIFILWYCWCLSFPTFSHLGVDVVVCVCTPIYVARIGLYWRGFHFNFFFFLKGNHVHFVGLEYQSNIVELLLLGTLLANWYFVVCWLLFFHVGYYIWVRWRDGCRWKFKKCILIFVLNV